MTRRTPLFAAHQALGARFVPFGGWEMPVQYQGIIAEHHAVRSGVGLFDVSHMGKFTVTGPGVMAALQPLVPSNLERLADGQAQYTLLLNDRGGVIDDVILYRHGRDHWTWIVNAATAGGDRHWICSHLPDTVTLEDRTAEQVLLAIQGPLALALLRSVTGIEAKDLPRFGHTMAHFRQQPCFVARTGYTGEDGVEVMTDAATGLQLWQDCLDAGGTPCGLGCRDTLRLEAAMHLYGQDLQSTISPLEAGLGWVVHWQEKSDFIGRKALEQQRQQGISRQLVGLRLSGRTIARHDYAVFAQESDAEPVGVVTSGTLSPTLQYPIALAYVPPQWAALGTELLVEIRQQRHGAEVVRRPFYRHP
jgi:aminomethyltransferase